MSATVEPRGPLTDRVAIVSGAGGRLGPVWCEALLGAGATVYALTQPGRDADRTLQALGAVDRLREEPADVTVRGDWERALARVQTETGAPPHVLVNNAGVDQPPVPGRGFRFEDFPEDGFRSVLDVNTVGAFLGMQVVGAAMAAAGRGSIVNVGSLYASVSPDARMYDHMPMDPPFLKPPAYGASKAALVNLSRYAATHLGGGGVRVNTLSPGGVAGGQDPEFVAKFSARVPLGRLGAPEELVGPLVFLASDASSYVTGTELKVDGGFTAW